MSARAKPARSSISASRPTLRCSSPEIVEFLAENDIGVTISIDGPPDIQDKFRVFKNGAGSYDVVAPKIKDC